ncbi:MarR family winged helix-turn-helix transcriptional regulator [Pantoea dispersa]|uniref:MarR family winged helix-turn-helix transcriptional regulator n=1 Tax=Pantoea dispersa TaxID=59814 RepID=UPI0021C79490|nr:MarR family winged helix-turn-helix transcriptional regulator [Pantoea dispersa]
MGSTEISDAEWQAWRGYRRLAEIITGRIVREINEATGLSGPDFMILMEINRSPQGVMLQRELLEYLEWDKSRLSHQLSRMAARDLVQRSRATRAGISVRMTAAGSQLLATARPIHAAGVRRNFLDLLTPEDIEGLIAITGRLRQSASGFIE